MSKIKIGYDLDSGPIRKDRCIRTSSGLYIDVFDPDPDTITIEDIAHSLSHQCRYGGHLPVFYSVANHSLWCSTFVGNNKENQLAALMHDASEAYLLDIPRPIKYQLDNYRDIEHNLMLVIAEKFGFEYPLNKEVKEIDELALQVEWDWFFGESKIYLESYFKNPSPAETKQNFIDKFNELNS